MEGYRPLAQMMSDSGALAIFRRYGSLIVLNLLYLQAELNELQEELKEIAEEDCKPENSHRHTFSRQWWSLANAKGQDSLQWKKFEEARAKLYEYNAALIQAQQLYGSAPPLAQDLSFLRDWLRRPKCGNNFLRGFEASISDQQHTNDMIVLNPRPGERDFFTQWTANSFLAWFHRHIGHRLFRGPIGDEEAGFTNYKDSRLLAGSQVLVTLLSSLLPICATIGLYFIHGTPKRLVAVALFMLVFATSLAVFTKARRVEVFAATAAQVFPRSLLTIFSPLPIAPSC